MALQAGVFDCVPVAGQLKESTLQVANVGKKIECLPASAHAVCSQFGTFVNIAIPVVGTS